MPKQKVKVLRNLRGEGVFVRVDFNVPLAKGAIRDDTRIRAALPRLEYLIQAGARLVLASPLGRPKGPSPEFSLSPVGARLAELLGRPAIMAADCVGPQVQKMAGALAEGGVLLLENVRFHKEEEANDPPFAPRLIAHTPPPTFTHHALSTAPPAHH